MPFSLKGAISTFVQLQHPLDLDNLLTFCKQFQIETVEELIAADCSKLKLLTYNANIDFTKLLQLQKQIQGKFLNLSYTLKDYASSRLSSDIKYLKCGSSRLNSILGVISPEIVEIYGPSAIGKTTLALSMALETALTGRQIHYIDTDQSFSKGRILEIINNKYSTLSADITNKTLSLIEIYAIYNMESFLNFVNLIVKNEKFHDSLIIIDSLIPLIHSGDYITDVREDHKEHHHRLKVFVAQYSEAIKWASYRTKCTFVFTRLCTDEWEFQWDSLLSADITIELKKQEQAESNTVNVKIINRSCTYVCLTDEITMEINDSGIV